MFWRWFDYEMMPFMYWFILTLIIKYIIIIKYKWVYTYMMGFEHTELMAKKWNIVKKINIVS